MSNQNKIVIGVDDMVANVTLLEAILQPSGYFFFGAASGPACLELLYRVLPRLILLDIQMPDMDGFEVCRRLRQRRELTLVPVAFVTASKTEDDVRAGPHAGGNDFIVKPFDRGHLLERVAYWASRTLLT